MKPDNKSNPKLHFNNFDHNNQNNPRMQIKSQKNAIDKSRLLLH